MLKNDAISVSQLVFGIKRKLNNDSDLRNIKVQGEIGNFTNHRSGHWYFTLKDSLALINCTMWKSSNQRLNFIPKVGDTLIVNGSIDIYAPSGQMNMNVTSLALAGAGDFYAQFEKMKQTLAPLGYFDVNRKKQIPAYPFNIAVIAGENTAALKDIRITIAKRWPIAHLHEVYAAVQGNQAPQSICQALVKADSLNCDVMILARGGGSVDDLWCFNDRKVADTIFGLKTPILTGIGHEIDTTIADLVADERCATPTAAGQRATPVLEDVSRYLSDCLNNMKSAIEYRIDAERMNLDYRNSRLENYMVYIENQKSRLNDYKNVLIKLISNNVTQYKLQLNKLNNQISQKVSLNIVNNKVNLENCSKLLDLTIANYKNRLDKDLRYKISLLDSLSPLKTLARGYNIAYHNNEVINSIDDVKENDEIKLVLNDGYLNTRIVNKEKKNG